MGLAVVSGRNVPSRVVDAATLGDLLDRIRAALKRPPAFSGVFPSHSADDSTRIRDSLFLVSDAARGAQVELGQALARFETASMDRAYDARLSVFLNELTLLLGIRATLALGIRRSAVLRRLLDQEAPDILGVIRRENDENSHSDVLRWLLDPREAPTLAPITLRALATRFSDPEEWRDAISEGVALGCISVRRDIAPGDLVVSGPEFVIALENEISATEHTEKTRSSTHWLQSLRVPLRAGIFLTPSGMPAESPTFHSLSYLELVACLLEAPTAATISLREERVLAGYLHTLARRILRAEFNAIVEMEKSHEWIE